MIEIYGRPLCSFCDAATDLCKTRNLKYSYFQVGVDITREEIQEQFPGATTYPQIKVNGHAIGGFDQLGNHLEETNYNGTGWAL